MSLPGHLIFYFTIIRIKIWQADDLNAATQTPSFVSFYISISVLQVLYYYTFILSTMVIHKIRLGFFEYFYNIVISIFVRVVIL